MFNRILTVLGCAVLSNAQANPAADLISAARQQCCVNFNGKQKCFSDCQTAMQWARNRVEQRARSRYRGGYSRGGRRTRRPTRRVTRRSGLKDLAGKHCNRFGNTCCRQVKQKFGDHTLQQLCDKTCTMAKQRGACKGKPKVRVTERGGRSRGGRSRRATPKKRNTIPPDTRGATATRAGLKVIEFEHTDPDGHDSAQAVCTSWERKEIEKGVNMVRDYIITAYEKWDARLFKKWFGKGTPESNADVKFRFKRAMDMMFSSSRFWKVLCCKSNRAFVCRNCSRNTIAYVLGKSWHNRPHVQMKSTSMRMCPYAFDRSRFSTVELGFTVLHELMHMSSGVGDQGYSKKECFHLAKRDPQRARLNAAAYCYFAMESAMPKAKYEKASGGMSIMNENCRDRFSNCFDLARQQGCRFARSGQGRNSCCASSKYFASQKKCGGSGLSLSSLMQVSRSASTGEATLKEEGVYDPMFGA